LTREKGVCRREKRRKVMAEHLRERGKKAPFRDSKSWKANKMMISDEKTSGRSV